MEKDFTQEDYELSKVLFRDMLKMFRSKHEGNTAIDECTLRNFAGFYSWCIVTGIIPFDIKIPNYKIIMNLEIGLDLYFGSDGHKPSSYIDSYQHTPSSELGMLTSIRRLVTPQRYYGMEVKDFNGNKIYKIIEDYKKEYEIK